MDDESEGSWPCKKSFSPSPEEEFRKDMLEGACNNVKGAQQLPAQEEGFPSTKRGGLDQLVRVYGYVMAAVYKWRRKTGAGGPVIINSSEGDPRKVGYPSIECKRADELYMLELAQRGMQISGVRMLATDVVTEEDVVRKGRKLNVIGSRGRNQIAGIYGQAKLAELQRNHPLSELYMKAAHEEGHEGMVSTLHRSRKKVWVIGGARWQRQFACHALSVG
jgi:hypothetical protein